MKSVILYDSGCGRWTEDEVIEVIRDSVGPEGVYEKADNHTSEDRYKVTVSVKKMGKLARRRRTPKRGQVG